jgi:putative ABC transport system substrate-binding protein
MIRRRDFITLLGGAAAAWPLAARAQGDRVRRLGALLGGDEGDSDRQAWVAEFRKGLAERGWIERRNIQIDWRWAAGNNDRAAAYAGELVALKPDVLFGDNTFVVRELQKATRLVPIVFAKVNDPIGPGFVGSLSRPGGNITGFADGEGVSLTKLPEFIKQLAPKVTDVAILNGQLITSRPQGIASAASSIGMRAKILSVHDAYEIENALADFAREPNVALIVPGDPVLFGYRSLIFKLAGQYRLPAVYGSVAWATSGGLFAYGTAAGEQYRGAAAYIDRILKGARPDELPVQTPAKYEIVINLKSAKALGIAVPADLLALADEVIE